MLFFFGWSSLLHPLIKPSMPQLYSRKLTAWSLPLHQILFSNLEKMRASHLYSRKCIDREEILLTGLTSPPCPASTYKQKLNAWKQHERSCDPFTVFVKSAQETNRNSPCLQPHTPIISCAFIMYMCMPVSDVNDIILHGHLWNKWYTLLEVMAIFFLCVFWFLSYLHYSRHLHLLQQVWSKNRYKVTGWKQSESIVTWSEM